MIIMQNADTQASNIIEFSLFLFSYIKNAWCAQAIVNMQLAACDDYKIDSSTCS